MSLRKILPLLSGLILLTPLIPADNISISQIDSSSLLTSQAIKLYLSVTDSRGSPIEGLTAEMFRVFESADGLNFKEVPGIEGFKTGANIAAGINFLLLLDNSGSMYDTIGGKPTSVQKDMRITHARQATLSFVDSITNPRDSLGLASFNTNYSIHTPPGSKLAKTALLLDEIVKPTKEEAYTELYASLLLAAEQMSGIKGRRVIIVLSDGENFPYFLHTQREHKNFKERIFQHTEPIELCQKEGISVFAVNFGREKDRYLETIALETGGTVFDASNEEQLSEVYQRIRNRILTEHLLTYRATMDPADIQYVKVEYSRDNKKESVTRFYFSSTIFGLPLESLSFLLVIPFLIALVLWWLLTKLRLEKIARRPTLEVLHVEQGSPSTKLFNIRSKKTVISGSEKDDLTIAGAPKMKENRATVIFDKKSKSYTVVGEREITVNNKSVKTRKLEPGDVINVGGTTIVFDDKPPR